MSPSSLCRSILPRMIDVKRPALRASLKMSTLRVDPSRLVQGLTKEKLDKDPALEEYLRANFPDAFDEEQDGTRRVDNSSPSSLPSSSSDEIDDTVPTFQKEQKPIYPLNIRPMSSYLRDPAQEDGSRRSRNLRHDGMIPGLLYGGNPNLGIFSSQPESKVFIKTPWRLVQAELERYHHHFESRVYDLTVLADPDDDTEGTVHRVMPRDLQRHPIQHSIYCVNFCRYHAGRPIKIPIVYINEEESNALKHDGFIMPLQRYVECFVEDGAAIPEHLELECTGLKFKEAIRMDRLILPEGVRFSDRVLKKGDAFVVGVVFGKGRGTAAEEEAVAEETAKAAT